MPPRYRPLVGEDNLHRALKRLEALGAERGIPVVLLAHRLFSAFEWPEVPPGMTVVYGTAMPGEPDGDALPPELRAGTRDPHPNAAGHALIARNAFEGLAAEGLWDDLLGRGHRGSAPERAPGEDQQE